MSVHVRFYSMENEKIHNEFREYLACRSVQIGVFRVDFCYVIEVSVAFFLLEFYELLKETNHV